MSADRLSDRLEAFAAEVASVPRLGLDDAQLIREIIPTIRAHEELRKLVGGMGGGPSSLRPTPALGSLRRVVLASPAIGGADAFDTAGLVVDLARRTMKAVNERLAQLPMGAKVAVKHEGDGRLAWMEFAPSAEAVVPDASWSVFKQKSEDGA